jgi:hypothetical protein
MFSAVGPLSMFLLPLAARKQRHRRSMRRATNAWRGPGCTAPPPNEIVRRQLTHPFFKRRGSRPDDNS